MKSKNMWQLLVLFLACAPPVLMAGLVDEYLERPFLWREPDPPRAQERFVWDVSGALNYCDQHSLRGEFHDAIREAWFGRTWKNMSAAERNTHNDMIGYANGVARGLELMNLSSGKKAIICKDARNSANIVVGVGLSQK